MAATVELTRGAVAIVDDDDIDTVRGLLWQLVTPKGYRFAAHSWRDGSGEEAPVRKTYLHRLIAGARQGEIVKARNGDYLDCRRDNLFMPLRGEERP